MVWQKCIQNLCRRSGSIRCTDTDGLPVLETQPLIDWQERYEESEMVWQKRYAESQMVWHESYAES